MEGDAAQVRVQLEKQEGAAIWMLQRHPEDSDYRPLSRVTSNVAR
jgi:hypothetical protein